MRGEVDALPFILAERMGCTVAEIDELPNLEYVRLEAWHVVSGELRKVGLALR